MFGVAVRFLAALVGSLATFFLVAHAAFAGGLISVQSIYRVDEFYTLAVQPLTTMERTTRQTLMLVVASLVVQGLLVAVLFSRWTRPQDVKPVAVERVTREALDQRFEGTGRYVDPYASRATAEATAAPVSERLTTPSYAAPAAEAGGDLMAALRLTPDRFRLVRAGEKV